MHTVQTFSPTKRSERQRTEPTVYRIDTTQNRQRLLHVHGPKLLAMYSTKRNKLNDIFLKPEKISTCAQLPLSNVLSFDDQQHCSRFNQNACGQMPNFKSVIQLAPMSMMPATQPDARPMSSTHSQPDQASWAP